MHLSVSGTVLNTTGNMERGIPKDKLLMKGGKEEITPAEFEMVRKELERKKAMDGFGIRGGFVWTLETIAKEQMHEKFPEMIEIYEAIYQKAI